MTQNELYVSAVGDEVISSQLLGVGEARDIAGMILFLLSERVSWLTGQNFFVDGGYSVGSYV